MNKIAEQKLNYKSGVKDGLPIGLGYLSVSFAFGVQAGLAGIPILLTVLISMTNLTSAGQLAGIETIVLAGSATTIISLAVEIFLTELVINSRYFLMSITLTQKFDSSFTTSKRFLYSAFVTDEIFAVGASKKTLNTKYFSGLATLPYLGWTIGTLLGATAGSILPWYIADSLGIALYAMFIAIIVPPSISVKGVLPTVLLASALSCLFFFVPALKDVGSGFTVIMCALVTASIMAFAFPVSKEDNQDELR